MLIHYTNNIKYIVLSGIYIYIYIYIYIISNIYNRIDIDLLNNNTKRRMLTSTRGCLLRFANVGPT